MKGAAIKTGLGLGKEVLSGAPENVRLCTEFSRTTMQKLQEQDRGFKEARAACKAPGNERMWRAQAAGWDTEAQQSGNGTLRSKTQNNESPVKDPGEHIWSGQPWTEKKKMSESTAVGQGRSRMNWRCLQFSKAIF